MSFKYSFLKNFRKLFDLFICLFIMMPQGVLFSAQSIVIPDSWKVLQAKQERLHKVATLFHELGLFNGVVLVAQDDEILLHKSYGYADSESQVPLSIDAKFRIGCISKQFTAVAIMQLVEKGLIDVQADIRVYLPEFPIQGITVHHLLTLSDGLPQFWNIAGLEKGRKYTRQELFEHICVSVCNKDLQFMPGTCCENTHTGYELLCLIIERITGLSYESYLQKYIFDVLGMHNTGCGFSCCVVQDLASEHVIENDVLKKIEFKNPCLLPGAGSLYSTTRDLYVWSQALKGSGRLVNLQSLEQLKASHYKVSSNFIAEGSYGYGLISTKMGNRLCVGHFGKISGYHCASFRFLDRNACINVLSNVRQAHVQPLTQTLAATMFGALRGKL